MRLIAVIPITQSRVSDIEAFDSLSGIMVMLMIITKSPSESRNLKS